MSTENIDIVVSQRGAKEVRRDLEDLGKSAEQSSSPVQALKAALDAASGTYDKLRAALGGAAGPVREVKKLMEELTRAMAAASGTNFVASLGPVAPSLGAISAAAIRAAGGVRALGDGFIMLGGSSAGALVALNSAGRAVAAMAQAAAGMGQTASAAVGMSASVQAASTSLSTMTMTASELGRRLVALGYILAILRDQFGRAQIGGQSAAGGLLQLTNGSSRAAAAMAALGAGGGGAIPPLNGMAAAAAAAGGAAGGAVGPVNQLSFSFFSLWRILLALAIIRQVTREVAESTDQWIMMSNKLRQVSTDSDNLRASQEAMYQSAQKTRSSTEDITLLYTRMSAATKSLGLSQREVLDMTETVSMAMKMNGGSVQETASTLRQLSQAFNKGKLDGDEFRTIMENAPPLQKAFADGLGVTTAKLMEMSSAGELTTPKLVAALQKAGGAIREQFKNSAPTMAEAVQYMGNSLTRFFGQLDEATGYSRAFYDAMKFLADNLGILGTVLTMVGAALLIAFGPRAIAAVLSFGAAVYTSLGPIGLIAVALTGLVALVYAFGDAWKVTADGITVLDYIRAALQLVGQYAGPVVSFLKDGFKSAWDTIEGAFSGMAGFFGTTMSSVGQSVRGGIGFLLGGFIGLYDGIVEAFRRLPAALIAIMQMAMNGMVQTTQEGLNAIIGTLNTVLSKVNSPLVPTVDLSGFKSQVDESALGASSKVMGAFRDGITAGHQMVDGAIAGITGGLDAITARARAISAERQAKEAVANGGVSTAKGRYTYTPPPSDDGGAMDKLERRLSALLRTIDPITGAQERLRAGTVTLNEAYAAGLITMERRDELLQRLSEHLRDQLDPLGKINRDMEKEASLLRLGNDEREVQRKLLDDIEKLRRAGVNISPVEQARLEENIRGLQRLRTASETLGEVLSRAFKGAEDALVEFVEKGKVDFASLTRSMLSDIARLSAQTFITKPLTNMMQNLMGGLFPGLSGGGGGLLSMLGLGGGDGGVLANVMPSGLSPIYATGGSFSVGGSGGVDSQLVQFRATPGERVSVERPGQGSNGGGSPVYVTIQAADVRSFNASAPQIGARIARAVAAGQRNM